MNSSLKQLGINELYLPVSNTSATICVATELLSTSCIKHDNTIPVKSTSVTSITTPQDTHKRSCAALSLLVGFRKTKFTVTLLDLKKRVRDEGFVLQNDLKS